MINHENYVQLDLNLTINAYASYFACKYAENLLRYYLKLFLHVFHSRKIFVMKHIITF